MRGTITRVLLRAPGGIVRVDQKSIPPSPPLTMGRHLSYGASFLPAALFWMLALIADADRRKGTPAKEYANSLGEIFQLVAEGLDVLALAFWLATKLRNHSPVKVGALVASTSTVVPFVFLGLEKSGKCEDHRCWYVHTITSGVGPVIVVLFGELVEAILSKQRAPGFEKLSTSEPTKSSAG